MALQLGVNLKNVSRANKAQSFINFLPCLTNLKLDLDESIRDLLVRAEEHHLNLREINENIE